MVLAEMHSKLLAVVAAVVAFALLLAVYAYYPGLQDPGLDGAVDPDLVRQTNEFGFDFYQNVSGSEGNLFFSPVSMDAAFALAYEGARGDTAKSMEAVFGFGHNDTLRRAQYESYTGMLNTGGSEYALNTANALWISDAYGLNPEYVDAAKRYYGATARTVDFASARGIDEINSWVRDSTGGMIERILDAGLTSSQTPLVITNAVYFKGQWLQPFEPGFTRDSDFYVAEDKTGTVKMMKLKTDAINHMQDSLVQMVELPYKGDRFSMLVLLPSERHQISGLEASMSAANLDAWRSQMSETMATVYLPRFEADAEYDLKKILIRMGMDVPFDRARADFGGILPAPGVHIGKAVHKAAVEVNELGTEAAAATAVGMLQSGSPVVFRADHPFVYVIVDDHTGQVLFMGRMSDPTR